jgi:OOP family OmpA-OmpF porin
MTFLRSASLAAVLLCVAETKAAAQVNPSLDVRTWRPSTDPSASLVLEPASTPGPWNWNVAAWVSYANRPVVLTQGAASTTAFRPVENLLGADLTANLGLGSRAAFGVDMPVFLYQEGSTGVPSKALTSGTVPSTGLGDLALTGKAAILTNDEGGFGLAVLGAVTVPTGDRESFMGDGGATVTARILADYSIVVGSLQASLGYTLRTDHHAWPDAASGVTFGDAVPWSIGVLLHPFILPKVDPVDRQTWEIAFHGSLPAGPVGPFGTGDPGSRALSPALLAVSERIALGHYRDTFVLVGGDVGLDNAVGVPTVRGVVSIGWAPREHDKDHDGVPDDVDQCPNIAEDRDGYEDNDGCPEMDNDEDGIPDAFDACPNVKGVPNPDPTKNGCPAPAPTPAPEPAPPKAP